MKKWLPPILGWWKYKMGWVWNMSFQKVGWGHIKGKKENIHFHHEQVSSPWVTITTLKRIQKHHQKADSTGKLRLKKDSGAGFFYSFYPEDRPWSALCEEAKTPIKNPTKLQFKKKLENRIWGNYSYWKGGGRISERMQSERGSYISVFRFWLPKYTCLGWTRNSSAKHKWTIERFQVPPKRQSLKYESNQGISG